MVGLYASIIIVCASSLETASLSGGAYVELLIAGEVPKRYSRSEKSCLEYEIALKNGSTPQRESDMLINHMHGYKALTAADNGRRNGQCDEMTL